MKANAIGSVILAAGNSSRLGQPKQFLSRDGEALVHRAVRAAQTAECFPIIVLAGNQVERTASALRDLKAEVVHHPHWQCGIGSSLRAGVAHALEVAPRLRALIVM